MQIVYTADMLLDPNTYYGFIIGGIVAALLTQFFHCLESRRQIRLNDPNAHIGVLEPTDLDPTPVYRAKPSANQIK